MLPGRRRCAACSGEPACRNNSPRTEIARRAISTLRLGFARMPITAAGFSFCWCDSACSNKVDDRRPGHSFAPPRRAKSHRGGAWGAGRQDRVKPADERDAGGDGADAVPELVRGFRPRPRQTRRPPPPPPPPSTPPPPPSSPTPSKTPTPVIFRKAGRRNAYPTP
jgi:hypothetical protein